MKDFADPRVWIIAAAVCAGLLAVFTAERREWGNAVSAALILACLLLALGLWRSQ
jgi:hypothetical protein